MNLSEFHQRIVRFCSDTYDLLSHPYAGVPESTIKEDTLRLCKEMAAIGNYEELFTAMRMARLAIVSRSGEEPAVKATNGYFASYHDAAFGSMSWTVTTIARSQEGLETHNGQFAELEHQCFMGDPQFEAQLQLELAEAIGKSGGTLPKAKRKYYFRELRDITGYGKTALKKHITEAGITRIAKHGTDEPMGRDDVVKLCSHIIESNARSYNKDSCRQWLDENPR